jgi:hypothetical protein
MHCRKNTAGQNGCGAFEDIAAVAGDRFDWQFFFFQGLPLK